MLDFLLDHDVISALIAFGLVLIPAVLVHEFGHFIAAKMVGITVLEFGIGFPPRVGTLFTWRGTEFTLNWLPIGGFVRPLGEDLVRPLGEEETERERQEIMDAQKANMPEEIQRALDDAKKSPTRQSEREMLAARGIHKTMAVYEAKPWPRIFFMVAGALGNFIFAFLIFMVVGLIGAPETMGRIGIAALDENAIFAEMGLLEGDVIEQINGEYFQDGPEFVDKLADFAGMPVTLTVAREAAGTDGEGAVVETLDVAVTPTDDMIAALSDLHNYVMVLGVSEESPAEAAGFLPGDLIMQLNSTQLMDSETPSTTLSSLVDRFAGEEVTVTVLRDGESVELYVVPRLVRPEGQGRMGIMIQDGYVAADWSFAYVEGEHYVTTPQSIPGAIDYAADRMVFIFGLIAEFPSRLMDSDTAPEERRIVSPVGVSQMGGDIIQLSIEEDEPSMFLDYVALISIALGFTNLLPIPALDGGRVLFVIVELIRGKPVSPEREGMVHLVGLLFMLSIGVFFIINDIRNPLTDIIPR